MNRKRILLVLGLGIMLLSSCTILEQLGEMEALSQCEFAYESISNLSLLGVSLDEKNAISDFSLAEMLKLTSALSGGSLPFSMDVNVVVRNPNTQAAAMNRMDWQLYLDNIHMVSGLVTDRVYVDANGGQAVVPFSATIDLRDVLSGEGLDELVNLAMNLSGKDSGSSRLELRIKPSINVGSRSIAYPGYVKVSQEF